MITVTEIEITDANSIEGATDYCWRQFGGAYPWWRGHAVFSWKLQASVHRPMPGAKGGVNLQYEVDIYANFRQRPVRDTRSVPTTVTMQRGYS